MSTHTKKLRRRHRKQARWMFPILLSVAGLISASLFNPWNVASAFDFFSNASSSQPPAGTSQPSSNTALSAGTPPSIDLSDIPGPFYGGLNVNSPLLEVGKYASLQVNATNAAGAEVSATSDEAQHFSGKLTLDIPVSEMLKATKEAMGVIIKMKQPSLISAIRSRCLSLLAGKTLPALTSNRRW